MSGRPDYDVGDLVVATRDGIKSRIRQGQVFLCLCLERGYDAQSGNIGWGVAIDGPMPPWPEFWDADDFRRIDPKPQEFFTGTIEANQREGVPA